MKKRCIRCLRETDFYRFVSGVPICESCYRAMSNIQYGMFGEYGMKMEEKNNEFSN